MDRHRVDGDRDMRIQVVWEWREPVMGETTGIEGIFWEGDVEK